MILAMSGLGASLGNVRTHGEAPFEIAVLHGGPGAFGEFTPLAEELAVQGHGVLEPRQTAGSVTGQIAELKAQLSDHGRMTVLGWSWGAWLGSLFAAAHPASVSRLVLVGSAPFRNEDSAQIRETRNARLTAAERAEIEDGLTGDPRKFQHAIELMDKADAYELISHEKPGIEFDHEIHRSVWREAAELRQSGELLRRVSQINCPVPAVHGDHDPHPASGVEEPLRSALPDAGLTLLARCGHKPWLERHAREAFYQVLSVQLGSPRRS